ncbi:MAG: hypothetical protein LQ338_006697 [Usnochroma carphineum]|nr:MAG: hypothetical protein LQ338_006697 [Usnochroma carphineum]
MTPVPDKFPVDPAAWRACVRGTGEEVQSWVCGRDVGRAVVELCKADGWEQVTYVAAEWSTFNAAIEVMESFYGRPMPRTHKSAAEIYQSLKMHARNGDDFEALELAQVEDLMINGCLACPEE